MKTRLFLLAVVLAVISFSKNSFSYLNSGVGAKNLAKKAVMEKEAKSKINLSRFVFLASKYVYGGSSYTPGTTVAKSSNGQFNLNYQSDGNLVLCNNSGTTYWASGPLVSDPFWVTFGLDGNINEWKGQGGTIKYWDANVNFTGPQPWGQFFWVLQDDGNFVRYGGTPSSPVYNPPTLVSTGTGGPVRSSHFNTITR